VLELGLDPLTEFYQAIRAKETRRHYERNLFQFLDYVRVQGKDPRDKARVFTSRARKEPDWTQSVVTSFLIEQKERAEKGDIEASSIANYVKPLRLFCEMNDIVVNWKKLSRKLPTGRHFANDRAPTKDEIKRLLEYPDRRIGPCLLTMASSGIRIALSHCSQVTQSTKKPSALPLFTYSSWKRNWYNSAEHA